LVFGADVVIIAVYRNMLASKNGIAIVCCAVVPVTARIFNVLAVTSGWVTEVYGARILIITILGSALTITSSQELSVYWSTEVHSAGQSIAAGIILILTPAGCWVTLVYGAWVAIILAKHWLEDTLP
jgi:hypothetical protein